MAELCQYPVVAAPEAVAPHFAAGVVVLCLVAVIAADVGSGSCGARPRRTPQLCGFAETAMGDQEADCGLEVDGVIDGHEADAIGVVEAEDAVDVHDTEVWENPSERPRLQT